MKLKILLIGIIFLLSIVGVSAALPPQNDVLLWVDFDEATANTITDSTGTYNFSKNGDPQQAAALTYGYAREYDDAGDMETSETILEDSGLEEFTAVVWYVINGGTNWRRMMGEAAGGESGIAWYLSLSNSNRLYSEVFDGAANDAATGAANGLVLVNGANPAMAYVKFNSTHLCVGHNNSLEQNCDTHSVGAPNGGATAFIVNCIWADSCSYYGDFTYDELAIFNRSLTEAELESMFNTGSGVEYSDLTGGSPPPEVASNTSNTFHVTTVPEDSSTQLNLSLAWINTNTTGTAAALLYGGTYYAANLEGSSYLSNGSANYSVTLTTPITTYNNTNIGFNWTYNLSAFGGVDNSLTSNELQAIVYAYPRLNISRVYNEYTNATLGNFSGNITKGSYSTDFSTLTNDSLTALVNGSGNYTVFVYKDGYAVDNSTNYQTLEILDDTNLSIYPLEFGLYSTNSVLVYVYDEDLGTLITDNVSLTVSGNSTEDSYGIINGSLLVTNLTDGEYNFKLEYSNYTSRTYTVTVADQSFQTLNAYLSAVTEEVILTFLDYDSSATIEGASVTMSRIINSSWVVVESKTSDITGRAQFSYIPLIKYRFYVSSSGYTAKTFELDPILFSSYNVRLNKVVTINETADYSKVAVSFTPKRFYNDAQNNLTLFFVSSHGVLETYSYNITYPSGSTADSGVLANGEEFEALFNISGASFFSTVNITYVYDTTLGNERSFSFIYVIDGATQGNNTYIENLGETYGLGILERVLIATLLVVIISGVVALALGGIAGLIVALLFMGLLSAIGFYPLWLFIISALLGFILIVRAGS